MAKVFIDDKAYEVDGSKNMLEVCLTLGMDLTYFCWHPALDSVGACRQCAILQYKDENDQKGRLTMACMLPAADGTRISIKAAHAGAFRASNIESLMLNHPHDCPVCDEGGECHLQDMTLMSGHNYRRSRFPKRTHLNQYLGPFINHEMNRCIQCYRCVRFYRDYAGGRDLDVFACHDDVYFGRSDPGVLENEFSGNLVEVCPTGVFTDKTLKKHYTRKWDLTNAPSICHQCSLGCNILAGERYGTLRRVLTRYNGDVNGYFLCDRGRFGYEYVNSPARIRSAMKRVDGTLCHAPAPDVLDAIKAMLNPDGKVIGIGSPRASLESNFMLRRLVGGENFYGGYTDGEGALTALVLNILKTGGIRTPSLAEAGEYDAVFVLGEDVTNTAPMLALALRQAVKNEPRKAALDMKIASWNDAAIREVVQQKKGPLFSAGVQATKLDELSAGSWYGTPDELAQLGRAVCSAVANAEPDAGAFPKDPALPKRIAEALMAAEKPLIVSGTSLGSAAIIQAAADLARTLREASKAVGLVYAVSEVNTLGLAMITERSLEDAVSAIEASGADTVIVLENDLYRRLDQAAADKLTTGPRHLVCLDSLENATTLKAELILPAGTFAESDGTVVNNEGRAQRFYQVYHPTDEIHSSWAWLDALIQPSGVPRPFDRITEEMLEEIPLLAPIRGVAPGADFRIGTQKIPRETHRYSGRTAITANVHVSEPKPPVDPDSPLSFTMEGYHGVPPSPDVPFYWAPGWNSVQAMARYQREVGGPLRGGNPGVRLLEPASGAGPAYAPGEPESLTPADGETLVVPLYHIFGSEELSARSPAIAERAPAAYVALHENDARRLGLAGPGDQVTLTMPGRTLTVQVHYDNSLPEGVAGLSAGWPETAGIRFPFRGKIVASGPPSADALNKS